jgi:hypothetical protein
MVVLVGCVRPMVGAVTPGMVASVRCAAEVVQAQGFIVWGQDAIVPVPSGISRTTPRFQNGLYGFNAVHQRGDDERDEIMVIGEALQDSTVATLRVDPITIRRQGDGMWSSTALPSDAAQRVVAAVRARCGGRDGGGSG